MANNITPQPNPEEIRELLSPYLDGEVSDAERAMVKQAVADSPELQEELESLRQTIALLSSLPPMPAPRPFTLTAADVGQDTAARSPKKRSWFPFPAWAGGLAALLGALICVVAAGGLLFGTQFGGGAMAPAEVALQQDSAAAMPTPTASAPMAAGAGDEAAESVEAYSADEDAAASEAAPVQPEQESLMVAPQEAPAVESMEMPAAEPVEEQAAPQRQAIEPEGRQEKAAAEQQAAMAAVPEAEEAENAEDEALEEEVPAAADEAAPPADDETALMAVPENAPAGESETGRQLPPTPRPQPTAPPPAAESGADAAAEAEVPAATPEVQATSTALAAVPTTPPPPPPTAAVPSTPRPTPAPTPPTPAGLSGWGSGIIILTTGLAGLLLAGALIWLALRRRQS